MVVSMWEGFEVSGELLYFWCLSRTVFHFVSVLRDAYSNRRALSGQRRTFTLLLRRFPSLFSYNALSSDRGVPGPALFAVMDGPWRSTVATVID